MGLMLSILVVCVGVIEALSCYEHFQYGILHCATNIYEHARRRSSVFLNYTSRRLKLLSEDSIAEDDHESSLRSELINEPVDDFINYEPRKRREGENKSKSGKKLAKFEKQDKIELVKQLLEKPSRPPRAARSISMPERTSLIYTEKDLELTKIINELAIEPIDEINVEVEEVDDESVIEEFDKLFDESEGKLNTKMGKGTTHEIKPVPEENLKVEEYKNEVVVEKSIKDTESDLKVVENEENEEKNELKTNTKSISQKISKFDRPVKISRSTSIDLDKVSLLLSKSTSVDSDRPKKQTIPKNLPEINSSHKSPSDIKHPSSINVIFENEQPPELIDKTFEELFSDMNDEFSNEEDVELNEIENIIIEALDDETVENLGKEFISNEIARYIENNKAEIKNQKITDDRDKDVSDEPTNEKYSHLLNKFADRIVCECLSEIRNLEINNLKLEILKNDEKAKNTEIQPEKLSFILSEPKSNKSKKIPKQSMTESSDLSNIKLPEDNDKPIILESREKEQHQELLNEKKMTDENKNKNLTPIKVQFSLEEETTESSGRSSPTGSVATILSVGSDDSSGSKPPEVSNEIQNIMTPEKILALTNEPVPALEYKSPVSDVCKPVDIIPMKWTDQVDKELAVKKDVIEILKEPDQQEVVEKTQKAMDSVSEKIEDKSLLVKNDIQEVECNKKETKPTESLVSCNIIQENVIVEEKPTEAREIVQESKNENSKSISPTQPKPEENLEKKPNDENKATNIPDDKKPLQPDVLVKNIEEVITAAPAEVLAGQKKENLETGPPIKADNLVGGDQKEVVEEVCKKEASLLRLEKPPEVLAITAENLLAIDYTPKVGTAPDGDSKKEIIPMEWKTENGMLEIGKEKLGSGEVHENTPGSQTKVEKVEVKESKPEDKTSLNDSKENLELNNTSAVVKESKKDGCPGKEVQENISDNQTATQKIEIKEPKPESNTSSEDNKKESLKLVDTTVVDESKKDVPPKEEVQKKVSDNQTVNQKIEIKESKPENNTSFKDNEKESLELVDTSVVKESKKDVPPKEEIQKNISDNQNLNEVKGQKPESNTSSEDSKKESLKLVDSSVVEESRKDVPPKEEIQKNISDNQDLNKVKEPKPESNTSSEDTEKEKKLKLVDTSVVEESKESVSPKGEVQKKIPDNQTLNQKIEKKEPKPESNTSEDSKKESLGLNDTSLVDKSKKDVPPEEEVQKKISDNQDLNKVNEQKSESNNSSEDTEKEKKLMLVDTSVVEESKKDVPPKEEPDKKISENQVVKEKIEVKEPKPESKTSSEDNKKESLELVDTCVVEKSKEGVCPKEHKDISENQAVKEKIGVKESKPESNTSSEDNKKESLKLSVVEESKEGRKEEVEKPISPIKEEAVLALEYKRKGNANAKESKEEVIPMEWRVDKEAPECEKAAEMINAGETKSLGATVHTSDTKVAESKSVVPEKDSGEKPKRKERKGKRGGGPTSSDENAKKPGAPETKEGQQSAPEAFWLIFSGEYTKAMSKDWHSGHFSCWQCDEALTGQRYVLRDDHPYCIKCYESVFANVCEECNKIIGIDSKDLSYKDKHWHEACFLCNKCRVSLVDKQFGSKADKIYCGNCYDAQFASRCDGCGEIFRAGTKKMEYKTRQWHEKCFCCCVCKTPIGTKSFIPREQEIYCATCYEEKFATRCVKCNKIITSGGVTYKNEPWHRECFTCTNCNTSLAGQRFTSRDEKPYCADCFGELFAKRCTSCSRPITGIGGTRFISFEDRHWHNDCFICASCKTSLVGRGFITDGDDIICPDCAKQKLM